MQLISQILVKKPWISLAFSFLVVILIGTFLLKLPFSTTKDISLVDALFTATSATCVTGLAVKNIGESFTLFGQSVILLLVQIGALGIMTAAGFFILLMRRKISIGESVSLKEILGTDYISEVVKLIRFIILITFVCETVGALLLFLLWQESFASPSLAIFNSIFHSVNAFCNAGFSPLLNGLKDFRGDVFVNVVITSLVILGGLGFIVLEDLKNKLSGWAHKQKRRLTLHSKIVLVSSLILIILGSTLFFIFENNNFGQLPLKEKILASYFQSVTARTAGFNTVDIGSLNSPTHLLLMFLMFIGGAPGSAAGGVKIISLVLLFVFALSLLKRNKRVIIFKREIPRELLEQAMVIFFISIFIILVFSSFLLYTEQGSFKEILFESFSAFGTVGLTAGLTPRLSEIGKILITILMFIGRIGPLSLVIIMSKGFSEAKIRFPEEKVSLG